MKMDKTNEKVSKVTFNWIDLGCTILPPSPEYGSLYMNTDSKILKAYNADGQWVTYEETNDPTLRKLLSFYLNILNPSY